STTQSNNGCASRWLKNALAAATVAPPAAALVSWITCVQCGFVDKSTVHSFRCAFTLSPVSNTSGAATPPPLPMLSAPAPPFPPRGSQLKDTTAVEFTAPSLYVTSSAPLSYA
ncbi:hypothetical protein Vretimale_4992, partial [Volvox reticuliferus]